MKARPHHYRDFAVYLKWYRRRQLGGRFYPKDYPLSSKGDTPTVLAFAQFDATGKLTSPRHPRVLRAVLRGKVSLNAQIEQWADGFYDCGAKWWFENELKPEFSWLPPWVWESMLRQVYEKGRPAADA